MKKLGIAGLVIIVMGFLILIALNANETGIIVWGGIRAFRAFQYLQTAIICIGILITIIGAIPLIKAQAEETRAAEREAGKLTEKQRGEEKTGEEK